MNRFKKISILTVAFLFAASFAFADEVGKFVSVEGRVDLLKAGAAETVSANTDNIVSAGDIVRTKSRSKAEISFGDNSSLKIGENSRVHIKEYSIENGKRMSGAILLERGSIRATVSKTSGKNDFTIDTPNTTGSVKGTDLFVAFQKSATSVLVVNGKFSVANLAFPDKVVDIASGNTTLIPADEQPQAPREYLALEKSNYEISTEPTVQKAVALKKEVSKEAVAEGYTEPGETKAKIIAVSGRVLIKNRGSITWHDAKVDELLGAGDIIETKENGKIEIRLDNGNVINLKSDSQLVLRKLTEDAKSGDYENLFESSHGKLRAKVNKLKGNSKFEIKTPTAVAAVRGTIMYLNIIATLTNTYFEEGDGYVTSLISNISKIVAAGNASSADSNGNVTDPLPPSDSERSSWQEGWGTDTGAEGYSPPGGNTGTDPGYNGDNDVGGDRIFDSPLNDVRINDTTGSGTTGGGVATTITLTGLTNNGIFGNGKSWDKNTSFNGTFSGNITTLPWSGTVPVSLAGEYTNLYLLSYPLWKGDIEGTSTDGGALVGWVGGTFSSNVWEGLSSSIYVDSSGLGGVLFGYISGTSNKNGNDENYVSGVFSGNGELSVRPMAQFTQQDIINTIIDDTMPGSGDFNISFGEGSFSSTFSRETMKIKGQNWGIWREEYEGGYYPGQLNWTDTMGGRYNNNGWFLTAVEGEDNLADTDTLRMDVTKIYLDYYVLGASWGTIVGTTDGMHDDYYDIHAIGLGGFAEAPLTFSGYFGNINSELMYRDGRFIKLGGQLQGLLGSTTASWWTNGQQFDFIAMGNYSDYANAGQYYWRVPFQSYNGLNNTATTIDGAAFYGYSIGTWDNNAGIDNGKVFLLYLTESGEAGIAKGDITNDISSFTGLDSRVWLTGGTLTPRQLAQGVAISPADLVNHLEKSSIKGMGYGVKGTDSMSALVSGTTYRLRGENWGIWTTLCAGSAQNVVDSSAWYLPLSGNMTNEQKQTTNYWITVAQGNDWLNGEVKGSVDGVMLTPEFSDIGAITNFYISKLIGNIFGTYSGTSDWQAAGVGSFERIPTLDNIGNNGITTIDTVGYGLGKIGDELMTGIIVGQAFAAFPEAPDRGDVKAVLAGTGNITGGSNWRLALGDKSLDQTTGAVDGYGLMTAMSYNPVDNSTNTYRGVYFDPKNNNTTFKMGSETGSITINTPQVDTTWTATATGTWVSLVELSQGVNGVGGVGFDTAALANMVSVPITETYSALLQGGNTGPNTITSITMDTSFYSSGLAQIWTSLINGSYNGTPGAGWSVSVANTTNGFAADLTNGTWSGNAWTADVVNGVGPNGVNFDGQAGGTYADGTLTGVGAGTWVPVP